MTSEMTVSPCAFIPVKATRLAGGLDHDGASLAGSEHDAIGRMIDLDADRDTLCEPDPGKNEIDVRQTLRARGGVRVGADWGILNPELRAAFELQPGKQKCYVDNKQ
jgi:hypothetical protein